jgi:hypothetical protein
MGEQEFVAGGVSQILLAVSQAMELLGFFSVTLILSFSYSAYIAMEVARNSIFLAFAILLLVTTLKATRRFGGSKVGTISAIFGIITAIIDFVTIIALIMLQVMSMIFLYYSYDIVVLIGDTFFALTITLLGSFFIKYREYLSNRGLWTATGVTYIIGGAFYMTAMIPVSIITLESITSQWPIPLTMSILFIASTLALIAGIMTIAAATMGVVCFFRGQALPTR